MTYAEKLKSPMWQKKRLEIFNRDNFKCCLCSDEKTELQVHHLKYTGEPWDAPNEDLQTLCCDCHFCVEAFKVAKLGKYLKISKIKKSDVIIFVCFMDNGSIHFLNTKSRKPATISFSMPFEGEAMIAFKDFWKDHSTKLSNQNE